MTLAARALGFGYRGHAVGRGVDLELRAGEVMCLLGPNGGGKTTLFKTLLGLLPAQAGSVSLDGRDLARLSRGELARRVGYVPQAHASFFPFSVREVVLMGRAAHLELFATPGARDRARAGEALAMLGIAHLAERIFTEISGGERQMTLIARALAQEPAILVMDEPTANLDFGNQARVLAIIRDLAARGLSIILSTHDPDQAFACADRVALLREGTIVAMGKPREVLTAPALRQLYGVEVAVTYVEAIARSIATPVLAPR